MNMIALFFSDLKKKTAQLEKHLSFHKVLRILFFKEITTYYLRIITFANYKYKN